MVAHGDWKATTATAIGAGALPVELTHAWSNACVARRYRLPYQEPGESRRPTLTWPRQIPFEEDGPQDVVDTVRAYGEWAAASPVPKLYVHAEPGFFAPWIKDVTASWANQRTVAVPGLHFVQEDSGADIGGHVAEFLQELELV